MNKHLIAAAAFSVCTLVFLIYSWAVYTGASAEAEDNTLYWENTSLARAEFAKLEPRVVDAHIAPPPPANPPEISAIMGQLAKDSGIGVAPRVDKTGAAPTEQSAHIVTFDSVNVETMGTLLENINKTKYAWLVSREISMHAARGAAPGVFNWRLTIAVPKPAK